MARLTREQINAAVARQKPGVVVIQNETAADARELGAAPDAVSPDLEQARQKYRKNPGARSLERGNPATGADEPKSDDDDVIVLTQQTDRGADAEGPGPKALVLDPKGNVLSEQG